MIGPRRSGWCGLTAMPWQHQRCQLEGCTCDCHIHVETEPLLWTGDQA